MLYSTHTNTQHMIELMTTLSTSIHTIRHRFSNDKRNKSIDYSVKRHCQALTRKPTKIESSRFHDFEQRSSLRHSRNPTHTTTKIQCKMFATPNQYLVVGVSRRMMMLGNGAPFLACRRRRHLERGAASVGGGGRGNGGRGLHGRRNREGAPTSEPSG